MNDNFLNEQENQETGRDFKKKISPFFSLIFDLAKLLVIAFIIVLPIHYFIFQPFYIVGPSMEPNFYDSDYLIIEKVAYRFRSPERGEIIIFKSPNNPKSHLIKRLIGLPGEKIVITKGNIKIYNEKFPQGFELKENLYLTPGTNTPGDLEVELKDDEYYLLGDNRNMSLDSRIFGPIKKQDLTGRGWFRGWPFKELGFIKTPVFVY